MLTRIGTWGAYELKLGGKSIFNLYVVFGVLLVFISSGVENRKLLRTLDYAVCFIVGEIIYSVAFDSQSIKDFILNFNFLSVIKIFAIVLSFFICMRTNSILKSLIICLVIYIIILRILL